MVLSRVCLIEEKKLMRLLFRIWHWSGRVSYRSPTHIQPSLPVLFVCSFVRSFVGSIGKVNLEKGEKREKKSKPGVKEGGGELSSWFFNQLHTFSPPFCCLPLVFLGTIWTRLTTRRPGPSPDGSSLTRLLLTFRHSCACSLTFYVTF